eukprot:8650758-Alexandrium_andersonii.AAC.1
MAYPQRRESALNAEPAESSCKQSQSQRGSFRGMKQLLAFLRGGRCPPRTTQKAPPVPCAGGVFFGGLAGR